MTPPAPTTYKQNEEIYLAFCRLTYRRSLPRCLVPAIVIVLLIGIGLLATGESVLGAFLPVLAGTLVGGALIAFSYWVSMPRRMLKNFRESASLHEVMTFTPSEVGFECKQASGVWHPKWTDMRKWEETKDFVAIFPNRTTAHLLPRDQLPDEVLEYVKDRLKGSGLPAPGKFRK